VGHFSNMTFEHSTDEPTVAGGFGAEEYAEREAGEKAQRSMMALVGVGLGLGVVHVLTGPDHLTALMSLSVRTHWTASPTLTLTLTRIALHRLCRRRTNALISSSGVCAQGLPEVRWRDAAG
jgi:glucokinase